MNFRVLAGIAAARPPAILGLAVLRPSGPAKTPTAAGLRDASASDLAYDLRALL